MKLLTIIFLNSLALAVDVLSNSPCFPNYHVENYNNLKSTKGLLTPDIEIVHDCYKDIPEPEKNIIGSSSHTKCFLSTSMFFEMIHDRNIPRCGQCLELHSSSLKTTHCIISGSFEVTNPENEYIKYTNKTILVEHSLFMMLSGFTKETEIDVLPVSFKFVDCLYKTYPAAVLTDLKDDVSEVSLFNTNVIVERIWYDNKYYYANETTTKFYITTPKKNNEIDTSIHHLKLFNFVGSSIFINFRFIPNNIFISSTPFPTTFNSSTSLCSFKPQAHIIMKDEQSMGDVSVDIADDDFFKWTIGFQPVGSPIPFQALTKEDPTFTFPAKIGGYSIKYPVPIRISQHYHYITLVTESTSNITVYYPLVYSLKGYNLSNVESFSCGSLVYKINITETPTGKYRLEFRINLVLSKCHGYSNYYILRFVAPVGMNMTVIENYWTNRDELNYTVCPNAFECEKGDECDPTYSTIGPLEGQKAKNYLAGCAPFCGTCPVGYSCNKAARCVPLASYNTRSSSIIPFILVSLLILLIF